MARYSLKAMLIVMAASFALAGCVGADSSAFVVCPKTQPVSKCITVTSGIKCRPGPGIPSGAPIKCTHDIKAVRRYGQNNNF